MLSKYIAVTIVRDILISSRNHRCKGMYSSSAVFHENDYFGNLCKTMMI